MTLLLSVTALTIWAAGLSQLDFHVYPSGAERLKLARRERDRCESGGNLSGTRRSCRKRAVAGV